VSCPSFLLLPMWMMVTRVCHIAEAARTRKLRLHHQPESGLLTRLRLHWTRFFHEETRDSFFTKQFVASDFAVMVMENTPTGSWQQLTIKMELLSKCLKVSVVLAGLAKVYASVMLPVTARNRTFCACTLPGSRVLKTRIYSIQH